MTPAMSLIVDEWLKCFQRLDCFFETDRAWFDVVSFGGLCNHRSNEIVCEDVCPDFFPNELWRFATQHAHLHGHFDRMQIDFGLPIGLLLKITLVSGRDLGKMGSPGLVPTRWCC